MSSPFPQSPEPSLQSIMASNGMTPPAATPPTPVPTHQPVAPSPVEQPASPQQYQQAVRPATHEPSSPPLQTQAAPTPSQKSLAAQLRARGFNAPEDMSDQELLDTVAWQIDEANRLREQAHSSPAPGMGQRAPVQPPPPAAQQEQASAAKPAASGKVSDEAQAVARAGLVIRSENGWEASNPAFRQFADELNDYEARRQATIAALADDPTGFLQQRINELGLVDRTTVGALQQQVQMLQEALAEQQATTDSNEFESWVRQNSSSLFINGDDSQLTPYAQKYNEFAGHVQTMADEMGQSLSQKERHRRTLALMKSAGQVPSQQQQQPAPQYASQPFMQQAAQTAARSPHNRLTNYPTPEPSGGSYIPQGRNGLPSLRGIINNLHQQR